MNCLSIHKCTKYVRDIVLFKDISFGLEYGEKAALIGRNGCGKSTLLNCIAGIISFDEGKAIFNKPKSEEGVAVSFLAQTPTYKKNFTIREHLFSSKSPKLSLLNEYQTLCNQLTHAVLTETQNNRINELEILLTENLLWDYENHIKRILTDFNITDFDMKLSNLSGGMLKKVFLAQALIEDAPLLMLDEPTNHLDIETIQFLETYLQTTPQSILMVTHDRYFLDNICTVIFELDNGILKKYKGNYGDYLEAKTVEREIEQNTNRRLESVLRTEREWLLRGPCARGTKSRARIDAIKKMEEQKSSTQNSEFAFSTQHKRLGGKILELQNITMNYPVDKTAQILLINKFSYIFSKGEKIGIFGKNGCGKTTLLNIITQEIAPTQGTVVQGDNTEIAYYRQNAVLQNNDTTVLEYIKNKAEFIPLADGNTLTATDMLKQFGFEGKILYSPVSTLSGGEKKRIYLISLLITNPNFLLLDEPTNDFDIFTLSVLESFLVQFKGCVLIVSHDRFFMDKVTDKLFIFNKNGNITLFTGNCSSYIEQKTEQREEKKEVAKNNKKAPTPPSPKKQKRTFKEEKEFQELTELIFEHEEQKKQLEEVLSGIHGSEKIEQASKDYKKLSEKLEHEYDRWNVLSELE